MDWYRLDNEAEIPSPALILHRERIDENLRRMIAIAGDPSRLWPHVKTHKLPALIGWQANLGVRHYKCATVAEAEMVATVPGVLRLLLASQPVGPQVARLVSLAARFPGVRFSALVDDAGVVDQLAQAVAASAEPVKPVLGVFIDLDVGQHRTGIEAGEAALRLARHIARKAPALVFDGLHAYDGHLGITDVEERRASCDAAFVPVERLRREIEEDLGREIELIAGGSPTFEIHAGRARTSPSPGTTVFWDAGYAKKLPDLPFQPAAVLLSRVISRPKPNQLCLDLGHKAVASEMPHPRTIFLNVPDATAVSHSEEHLVIETPAADRFALGDVVYSLPWHVCPTVALHSEVWLAENRHAETRWPVVSRARRITL
jgi:D-serine deaminase-like pyridoxal phosphate-dependent protein